MKVGEGTRIYETAKIATKFRTGEAEIDIGDNCLIGDFTFVAVRLLKMQYGSQIAPHAMLSGGGFVLMGKFSVVGFGAHLITGSDTVKGKYMCEAAPAEDRHIVRGGIILEEGAYLGANVVVCVTEKNPIIVIGAHSVVGAMSYIDKWVPPNTIIYPKQALITKPRELK